MNDEHDIGKEEVVDQAVQSLREAPVPEGPPPEAVAAVLAAGTSGSEPPRQRIRERIFKMNRFARIAAAVVIVGGLAGVLVWLTAGKGGSSVAWADVQQRIRDARTMTFTVTMRQKDMPEMVMKMMLKEPGLMRQEFTKPAKVVNIMDISQGKMLCLIPQEKKVLRVDLGELPDAIRKKHEEQNYLAEMKKLIEESESELGEKDLDGRQVKGYRLSKLGIVDMTIWVDAKTGKPVQIEMALFGGATAVMTELEFDAELTDDLFSLEVPEGYTLLETSIKLKVAGPEDVVELLRVWASARDGQFPQTFSPLGWTKDAATVMKGLSEKEALKVAQTLGRVALLMQVHPKAHYAGKGVRLGDKETAIFWFKPRDSKTYKVIYGDLRIEDVAEEDLPETDQAEEQTDE